MQVTDQPKDLREFLRLYEEAVQNDPVVQFVPRLIADGTSEIDALKYVVATLVKTKNLLFEQLKEADAIKPMRYMKPDGTIVRWDAPDEFVPLQRTAT